MAAALADWYAGSAVDSRLVAGGVSMIVGRRVLFHHHRLLFRCAQMNAENPQQADVQMVVEVHARLRLGRRKQ